MQSSTKFGEIYRLTLTEATACVPAWASFVKLEVSLIVLAYYVLISPSSSAQIPPLLAPKQILGYCFLGYPDGGGGWSSTRSLPLFTSVSLRLPVFVPEPRTRTFEILLSWRLAS